MRSTRTPLVIAVAVAFTAVVTVWAADYVVEQTLHEHFTRVTQRFVATLEDATEDGMCWRVDLRLRPEGSRGPLVNALAAAERYYETWGRTWERAALLRAYCPPSTSPFASSRWQSQEHPLRSCKSGART